MAEDERLPRGPKGDKGDAGMPAEVRRAVIFLFVLNVLLTVILLFAVVHYVDSEQAQQQQQGRITVAKLCQTLDGLASAQPPPGNPATNPSRAYDQRLHAQFTGLADDLHCH
jgi:glycerol uptake facilitator-like aquaporin